MKLVKKRTKTLTQASWTDMSTLNGTDGNPEALTTGSSGNSRARYECPALVTGVTRTQRSHCPGASRSSWSTASASLQCCWRATTFLRLGYSQRLLQELKATVERAILPALRVTNPTPGCQAEDEQTARVHTAFVLIKQQKLGYLAFQKKILSLKHPQRAGHNTTVNLEFYTQLNSFRNEYKLKTFPKGKRGSGCQQYTCTTRNVKRNSLSRRKTILDGNLIYMKEER